MASPSSLPNATVLVTGAAGFVGSNLVAALVERHGARVIAVDDLFTGDREHLRSVMDRIEFRVACVTDDDTAAIVREGADYVFHLAARNIIASTEDPVRDFDVNARGTLKLLMAARESKRLKRFVYSSTASVYGNPQGLPASEGDPTSFLSPYAASKHAGEAYCQVFYEQYGVSTSVVRYSNVYGRNQSPKNPYCGVVGKFTRAALAGEALLIHGDGEQTRDYTYISDAVDATIAVAVSANASGHTYNVGSGAETSVNRLAEIIVDATGSKSPVQYLDRRDIDNVRRRVLNIEKIRREVRWSPQVSLRQGLQRTVAWHRETAEAAAGIG
jgi:UDP-glucose 4-epimerase